MRGTFLMTPGFMIPLRGEGVSLVKFVILLILSVIFCLLCRGQCKLALLVVIMQSDRPPTMFRSILSIQMVLWLILFTHRLDLVTIPKNRARYLWMSLCV